MFFISAFIAGVIIGEVLLNGLTKWPAYKKPIVDILNKPSKPVPKSIWNERLGSYVIGSDK